MPSRVSQRPQSFHVSVGFEMPGGLQEKSIPAISSAGGVPGTISRSQASDPDAPESVTLFARGVSGWSASPGAGKSNAVVGTARCQAPSLPLTGCHSPGTET